MTARTQMQLLQYNNEVLDADREDVISSGTERPQAREEKSGFFRRTRSWEQRQNLYRDYSRQVTNLNRKFTMDANQVKKHAEKLSNMFMEQQKFINESLTLQKSRMEEFKSLCEEYLEKFEVLRDSRGNSIAEELRCLIATLERKLLMLHSQQETAVLLHSLSWICYSHNTLEHRSRYEGSRNKPGEAACGDVCSFCS
ncbi:X-linked lymphocyte-regulated protein 3C [Apodemus speciosus]|uniref:X-linked lymphocyte-regulated protein 3C n=1 Tax=Apodemus speciosus TaxID=105296 RepID=A0ABQ0FUF0_APOSI